MSRYETLVTWYTFVCSSVREPAEPSDTTRSGSAPFDARLASVADTLTAASTGPTPVISGVKSRCRCGPYSAVDGHDKEDTFTADHCYILEHISLH